jgi:hypothetical protein
MSQNKLYSESTPPALVFIRTPRKVLSYIHCKNGIGSKIFKVRTLFCPVLYLLNEVCSKSITTFEFLRVTY